MEQVDIVIIGAGVVGLALAERLSRRFSGPDREIVLVERNDGFGRETSSRNSEVIHAGLYYGEDLLKTRLCVRGRCLLYELCEKARIPYRKTGKLVLATAEDEIEQLEALEVQAKRNGVPGVRPLGPRGFELLEPYVFGLMGLYCPESGIVDSHQLMSYFEHKSESRGVTIAYNCSVMGLQKNGTSFTVRIDDADGENLYLETSLVINAAGLGADTIAEMAGIDIDTAGYRIYPCKGEYFAVSGRHTDKLNLIGIESPGLTSCLSIAEMVDALVEL